MGCFSNERSATRALALSDFTLRNHKKGITALQIIEMPLASKAPVLISGDSQGLLVMWDLVTKRPITSMQMEGDPHIVAFQWVESSSVLSVLCKDSMLRMFKVKKPAARSTDLVSRQYQSNKMENLQYIQIYEMPINTLNFANFIMDAPMELETSDGIYRLVCCHTSDSEAIDIYQIIEDSTFKLQRPFSDINFPKFLKELNFSKLPKDSKFGIIMRFARLNDVIFLGFENGFIIGFTTTFDEDLRKHVVELVHVSNDHYPNPILNMCVNGNELYSCSTDDFITKHKFSMNPRVATNYIKSTTLSIKCSNTLTVSEPLKIHLPLRNISHIEKVTESTLLVSSWSGKTIVLNVHTSEVVQTFMKTKNNLIVNDSSIGDLTNGNNSNAESSLKSNNYKVGAMTGLKSFHLQSGGLKLGELRRFKGLADSNWCIIGYDDGTIKLNKV